MDQHPKDAWCREKLARKPSAEARAWLADQRILRSIGAMGPTASVAYVDQFYALGAVAVLAMDIKSSPARPRLGITDSSETARGVIVELPANQEARSKLFAIEASAAGDEGFDATIDEGQSLLFFKAT